MANNIADQICDAVDLLINKRVSSLQFDKTVRATVLSVEDASIGKYRVQYQNSIFYAYADPETSYKPKAEVYVEIPSSDYNKTKLIIGSVKKMGGEFLSAVTAQGRMTKIGTNVLTNNNQSISFCSYNGQQTQNLLETDNPFITVDNTSLSIYKQNTYYFMLEATVQTSLPVEQQVGGGNYGLILEVDYYTAAQKQSLGDQRNVVTRTYVLDVNNMLGQPYKYLLPDKQYAIFAIDGNNLKEIKSLTAFCKGFPVTKQGQPQDIFLSNIEISFMDALSNEELSNASLKILTPYGSYFTSLNDDMKYLEAELKLKGKIVNLEDQNVDFYWFIKDTGITSSNQLYYSAYAGQGWRCLNASQTFGGLTQFVPEGYRKHITIDMAPADVTTFKCVAVYNGTTLSDTIGIRNNVAKTKINITSSAGTQFYFDTGKTTLTCQVQTNKNNLSYSWGYRVPTGEFVLLTDKEKTIDVNIAIATSFITYECTVYYYDNDSRQDVRLGSAEITLTNGIPQNEYTLVINNGTQVFKYDEYGVSPASRSAAAADKITIPTLSFDIYNDLGQLVTPVDDADKIRLCDIKWIWPDEEFTLLEHSTFDLQDDLIVNPTTNGNVLRKVLSNSATLTFEIKNRFDLEATDNNIQLEVNFQGHNLVASTNFTFVKEGVLGTNGTKYISRLIPIRDTWKKIYLQNGHIYGWNNTITKTYNPVSGIYDRTQTFVFDEVPNHKPLKVQLWDGAANALYDSVTNTDSIDADLDWEIVDVGKKSKDHNAAVAADGVITPGTEYKDASTVIKTTISTSELSESARKYYATYPLDISMTPRLSTHAIVVGGFDECMYNSDGTRSSFNTKPFTFRVFKENNLQQLINEQNLTWTVSWYNNKKNEALLGHNNVEIDPPAFFDSTTTNNYIKVNYTDEDGEYTVILSIHLYLNRYGMAAMNDWDGTSIKLNTQGDQYILAPQIGAGQKNNDNSFTGITMGKSFNVNGNALEPEIGLMGFNKGIRSIFLDAQTGRAMFGSAQSGQITISPQKYGAAPTGAIYSWNFYNHDSTGKPTSERDEGLLIDLQTPEIRFGTGNFSVTKEGYLTAKGGGSISGWKITDNYLRSPDNKTTLYSDQGPFLNGSDSVRERFNIGNGKFTIYSDGTFKAANNKFSVSQDGTIYSVAGHIGGWEINGNSLFANGITINSNGNIKGDNWQINRGDATFNDITANGTGHIAGWEISSNTLTGGSIALSSNGQIRHTNGNWWINGNGYAHFKHVDIDNTGGASSLNWGTNFSVTPDGFLTTLNAKIGPWDLTATGGLFGPNVSITPSKLNYGSGLEIDSGGSGHLANIYTSGGGGVADIRGGGLKVDGSMCTWTDISYINSLTGTYNVRTKNVVTGLNGGRCFITIDGVSYEGTVVLNAPNKQEIKYFQNISLKATRGSGYKILANGQAFSSPAEIFNSGE